MKNLYVSKALASMSVLVMSLFLVLVDPYFVDVKAADVALMTMNEDGRFMFRMIILLSSVAALASMAISHTSKKAMMLTMISVNIACVFSVCIAACELFVFKSDVNTPWVITVTLVMALMCQASILIGRFKSVK